MVRQQAVEIFRNFDKDNSGTLSKTEVLNMLDTIFPKKFSIKDVEEKFSLIDGNTDGCINYEEFVKTTKTVDDAIKLNIFFRKLRHQICSAHDGRRLVSRNRIT